MPPTPSAIGVAEACGLIAVTVRNPSIRHTSARSEPRIKVFRTAYALVKTIDVSLHFRWV